MGLLDVFLAGVPHASTSIPEPILAQRLADLYAEGQALWPKLALSKEAFARHLAQAIKTEVDVLSALEQTRAEDFYLAAACVFRVVGAERAFIDRHLPRIGEYVSRIDPRDVFADEVTQEVSRKLLVAEEEGEVPKIRLYTGRGALGGFVRSTATRIAKNMKRNKILMDRLDTAKEANEPARNLDPEVALLKKRFSTEFNRAFAQTLELLSQEERNLLKLHYMRGLSIEDVAAACNVSRATAARWLSKARTRIVQLTYKSFAQAAGPTSASPESILALVKSELGATVAAYFDSEASPK